MAKRRKSSPSEYSINHAELTGYSASIGASINHKVREPRYYEEEAKVYDFGSHLELEGFFIEPEERAKDEFQLTVYGSDSGHCDFELTLADCQVRDDNGMLKYRKARGKEVPVYDVPKGIGYIKRQRGTRAWSGCVWVKQRTVTDMLTLLPNVQPLFLEFHERHIGRTRWIAGLTLVTKNPEDE